MEGNRNSKDWGESCLDKLGRFSEGLKEVRLIDQSKEEIVFWHAKHAKREFWSSFGLWSAGWRSRTCLFTVLPALFTVAPGKTLLCLSKQGQDGAHCGPHGREPGHDDRDLHAGLAEGGALLE
jgi:hypothetical protein